MAMDFRVIDGCPVGKNVAPYIYICIRGAHTVADSIYRGDDARKILNAHGKHSQYQLVHATAAERVEWDILGTPDPVGESTHEMYSDAHAYPEVPARHRLPDWWMQGFDVPTDHAERVLAVARTYHWELFRPYSSGSELHHLNFRVEPKPHSLGTSLRIKRLRLTLPRR